MVLNDFKLMLGIDGQTIKEESCCCAKSAAHSVAAQNAVSELKYGGVDGERLFDCFNSVQGGHYEKRMAKYPFVYMFMGEGEVARFYALYEVKEKITILDATKRNLLPLEYKEKIEGENWIPRVDGAFFVLQKIRTPSNLEGRLLVRFASGQQNAPTFLSAGKYEVTRIEPVRIATEFTDFKSIYLTYNELKHVIKDEKWQDMLARFGGVYLIHDSNSGENYVGSAYNKDGFLGRWIAYAKNPTGGTDEIGNAKLVKLLRNDPEYAEKYFRYSILEVLSLAKNGINQEIFDAETRWKVHLGTRTNGLNAN